MLPATAKEAREIGSTRYFTGKPCKHGHVAPRRTSGGHCVECTDAAVSAYRKTERGRAWMRDWSKTDTARAIQKRRRSRIEEKAYQAFWKRTNEARPATPDWLTQDQRNEMLAFYIDAAQRDDLHHVDHIIPLTHTDVCGLHVPWNLQVLTAGDNMRKHSSFDGTMENEGWR